MEENIAAIKVGRCQLPDCRTEDFLPYKCKFCEKYFCGDHRTPESHLCTSTEKVLGSNLPTGKESQGKTQKRCAEPTCRLVINLVNGYICKECGKEVCLKHRFKESHPCVEVVKIDSKSSGNKRAASEPPKQKQAEEASREIKLEQRNSKEIEKKTVPPKKEKKKKGFGCFACFKKK